MDLARKLYDRSAFYPGSTGGLVLNRERFHADLVRQLRGVGLDPQAETLHRALVNSDHAQAAQILAGSIKAL